MRASKPAIGRLLVTTIWCVKLEYDYQELTAVRPADLSGRAFRTTLFVRHANACDQGRSPNINIRLSEMNTHPLGKRPSHVTEPCRS